MQTGLRFSRTVLLGGVALGAALFTAGCNDDSKQKSAAAPPPPDVDVVTVQPKPVVLHTELPGRVNAHRTAEIRPQVNGIILKRTFVEGAQVKAGQQLYQIDPRPYEAALSSAKASLAHAEAEELATKATLKRDALLVKSFAVSRQDYDNALAADEQSKADIETAKASMQSAQINMAYTHMYSPIKGRIGRTLVTEGALVTANQTTALATVTELDPIYVDVTQPAAALLRLKQAMQNGELKKAGEDAAEVRVTLDDGTPYPLPGKLEFSEVTVDQSTGSITLRALLPNPDGVLLPGMFVHETLTEGMQPEGLLVPQRAVTHNDKGDATALVLTPDNIVAQRILTLDRNIGQDWLVSKGLKAGDQVIVSGLQSAMPGKKVTPHDVDAAPAGAQPNDAAPTKQ